MSLVFTALFLVHLLNKQKAKTARQSQIKYKLSVITTRCLALIAAQTVRPACKHAVTSQTVLLILSGFSTNDFCSLHGDPSVSEAKDHIQEEVLHFSKYAAIKGKYPRRAAILCSAILEKREEKDAVAGAIPGLHSQKCTEERVPADETACGTKRPQHGGTPTHYKCQLVLR